MGIYTHFDQLLVLLWHIGKQASSRYWVYCMHGPHSSISSAGHSENNSGLRSEGGSQETVRQVDYHRCHVRQTCSRIMIARVTNGGVRGLYLWLKRCTSLVSRHTEILGGCRSPVRDIMASLVLVSGTDENHDLATWMTMLGRVRKLIVSLSINRNSGQPYHTYYGQ